MVGMASKNAGCPPELFGQDRTGHHVRPDGLAESDQEIGGITQRVMMCVRRSDQEPRLAHAIIASASEDRGKFAASELLAPLVERHGS